MPAVKPGTVNVILGSTFTALKTATTSKPPTATLTQTFGGITGGRQHLPGQQGLRGPDGG